VSSGRAHHAVAAPARTARSGFEETLWTVEPNDAQGRLTCQTRDKTELSRCVLRKRSKRFCTQIKIF
jgi:hypothetical protein